MSKINTYKTNFCFKGTRNYVQGPDIYNLLGDIPTNDINIRLIRNIDMKIHNIFKNNLDFSLYKDDMPYDDMVSAVISFDQKSDKYFLLCTENNDKIDCKIEYSENELVNIFSLDIDKKRISIESETSFTPAEVYTAMNKSLLKAVFPETEGKWFLTRLQTNDFEIKKRYNKVVVKLIRNLNFKITKSSLTIDGKKKGFIYFTLLR